MNSEEEKSKKKKIILLLLLLLLFLIAFGMTILFLNDDGTAEAAMHDQLIDHSIDSENNHNEVIVTNENTNEIENETIVTKTSNGNKKTSAIHQTEEKDTTPPTIKGITDHTWYTVAVSAIIADDSDYTATLSDDQGNRTSYKSGTSITKEGHYTLEVVDKNGNKTVYEFGIDTTKPNVSGIVRYSNENVTPVVEDLSEVVATLNGKDYKIGTPITEDGNYQLIITDAAGNQTEVEFTIDKTAPILEGIPEIGFVGEDFDIHVIESNLDSIVIVKYGASAEEGYPKTVENGYTITEEGCYVIEVTDKAGNTIRVNLGIDKTSPIILGVEEGAYYRTPVRPIVQELKIAGEILLNGKPFENGSEIAEEGEYTLEVTDMLGRTTSVHFVIDTTKPAIESIEVTNATKPESEYIKNGETVKVEATFTEELAVAPTLTIGDQSVPFEKEEALKYVAEITIPAEEATLEEGLVALSIGGYADQAGNVGETTTQEKASKNITYDRTVPTITVKPSTLKGTDGVYSYIDLVVSDNFMVASAFINEKEQKIESQKTGLMFRYIHDYIEGNNKVVVVDKAGNEKTFSFVLDTIKPAVESIEVTNATKPESEYIKNGETVKVEATFTEELAVVPTLTIGDQSVALEKEEALKYVAEITIPKEEAKLKEGLLAFSISGYADQAGNVGETTTQEKASKNITYDRTVPTITVKPSTLKGTDGVYSYIDLVVSDNFMVASAFINEKEHKIESQKTGLMFRYIHDYVEGENKVVVVDKAGNETTFSFVLDTTEPAVESIEVTNATKPESEYIKNGETVKVEATFTEELTVAPTLTIGDQSVALEKEEALKYVAEITIPAEEATLEEGLLALSISGYADQAGNVGETTTQEKASKNITYDRTVPTITVKPSTLKGTDGIYSHIDLVISDNFMIASAFINEKEHKIEKKSTGLSFNSIHDYVEGENKVVVVDKAGNEKTFTFVLDTIKPELTMFRVQNFYNPAKNQNYAKIGDNIAITICTTEPLLGKPQIEIGKKTFDVPVQEAKNNKYVVYVTLTDEMELPENRKIQVKIKNIVDIAENEMEGKELISTGEGNYYVIFDKTAPSVSFSNLDEKGYLVDDEQISVSDKNEYTFTIKDEEGKEVKGPEAGTKSGEQYTSSIDASEYEDGKYTIEVMDIAGNVTTKTFKIDHTAPEIVSIGGTTGNKYWKQTYEFSIKIKESNIDAIYYAWSRSNNENAMNNALKGSSAVKVAKEEIMNNGDGTYTVKIKANKEGKYTFNVKVVDEVGHPVAKRKSWYQIDNTAPSLQVGEIVYGPETKDAIYSNDNFTATVVDTLSKINKIYINEEVKEEINLTENGTYVIRLVDKAGNESKFTVIVEK